MIRGTAFSELLSGYKIVQVGRQTTQNNFSREKEQHKVNMFEKKKKGNCDYYRIVK